MVEAVDRPKSRATLRSHHLNEALTSVVIFTAGALFFWAIRFGTDASPSMPRMLVTVMLPIVLLKEYFLYVAATKRLGFVAVPKKDMAAA
jgi:hypothetical protein